MLCREYTLVKHLPTETAATPLKCRSWGCEECAPERKQQLKRLARDGKPNTLITLTVNPAFLGSPEERAAALAASWRTIVAKAKRRYSYKRLSYFCVFEATKAGEPHLHILARCKWLDQRWLSAQMAAMMQAPVCDIRRIKSLKQVASYVAKYVGKAPHRFASCKRYWTTQDWERWRADRDPAEFPHQAQWSIVRHSWHDYLRTCTELGWSITIKREWATISLDLNTFWRGRGPP